MNSAAKAQCVSKAPASEQQGTSKAAGRDPKRRSTEEATSEAKKKRRSRDKEAELKEVGGVCPVCTLVTLPSNHQKPTLVMTSVAVP